MVSQTIAARGAPATPDVSTAALNKQLASIAGSGGPEHRLQTVDVGLPAARPASSPPRFLSHQTIATLKMLAARYSAARRLLYYRTGGFDANLWGELGRSRTLKVGYSV